jgi:hypothetical protein
MAAKSGGISLAFRLFHALGPHTFRDFHVRFSFLFNDTRSTAFRKSFVW